MARWVIVAFPVGGENVRVFSVLSICGFHIEKVSVWSGSSVINDRTCVYLRPRRCLYNTTHNYITKRRQNYEI